MNHDAMQSSQIINRYEPRIDRLIIYAFRIAQPVTEEKEEVESLMMDDRRQRSSIERMEADRPTNRQKHQRYTHNLKRFNVIHENTHRKQVPNQESVTYGYRHKKRKRTAMKAATPETGKRTTETEKVRPNTITYL